MDNYKKEIIEYYNDVIPENERKRSDNEKKEIEQVLSKLKEALHPKDRILDLGCGNGNHIQRALAEKQINYLGVDIAWRQLEYALAKNPNSDYLLADFMRYDNYPRVFKGIILKQVIQEVTKEELPLLFAKIAGLLDKEGLLFISFDEGRLTPNGSQLYQPHFNEVIELAEKAGFKLNHIRYSKDEKTWAILLQH